MSTFQHVLSPAVVGGLELKNRVIMPPMGTAMSTPEGFFSERQAAYYAERARGGVALVVTELTSTCTTYENMGGLARMDADECIPGLAQVADAVHAVGGLLAVQLTPGQGRNNPAFTPETPPVSASDNPSYWNPAVLCRPLETEEVRAIVRSVGEAAARCAAAGADWIDVHGHTGYLLDQFLGRQWNRRTDEYGGSVENRTRFATEIIQAVKAAAPGLPVSFRLSVLNHVSGGRDVAEAQQIALLLQEAGLDLLMADDGSYDAMDWVFPPYYLGDDCMVPSARAMKEVLSIPVMAVGNLTPESAEAVLAAGDADFVGVGRGHIADPAWVGKLASGSRADIRPCIRCNQMCIGNVFAGGSLGCAVNPEAGNELTLSIERAPASKRVVVVGAGPAGLEAARVAGLRGHTVDVYEQADHIGGVLWPAASPDFKRELRGMVGWWEGQLAGLPVTVHTGTRIDASSPELDGADDIVVATGSLPLEPRIPGIDGPNVVDVLAAHQGATLGHRVVVAGGGLSGADLALELAHDGHDVTLVEMADDIAQDMLFLNRLPLLRQLAEADVRLLTQHKVTAVDASGVTVVGPDGPVAVEADTVVAAFGVRPATSLVDALAGRSGVHPVGDCVTPAKVGEAVNAGYRVAVDL
ncbi:FAD-dependent oxidoreductase [Actinotalea sp. M2MS4P-6]|uniref:oxidoreductase n=1 Tax=Actinotalea sp. M2MS4P-6 TaxID=2983762 RepID=UPI0021E41968|nr:FAD-dependent oxidoreductase [Actinotalea sp. M2MS4P-6]MCV2394721.1 FAD-dependent oxidoreductase [Actinotalea sp. M2MS4P-6]